MVLPTNKVLSLEQFFLYSSIDTIVCMFLFPENSFQHSKKCKGTVVVKLSAPPLMEWHVRLTWYRFTKEAIVVFVSSLYLMIFCKSVFKETTIENNRMSARKEGNLIHLWSAKGLKRTVVNSTCQFINEESFEITSSVPLKGLW